MRAWFVWIGMIAICLLALPAQARYTPQFSVTATPLHHYWILDHGEKIAIFGPGGAEDYNYSIGLIRQYPGQAVAEEELSEPEIISFITRRGLGLYTYWISNKAMEGVVPALTFNTRDPQRLRIHLAWDKSAEEHGTQDITLTYDTGLRRYLVTVEFDLVVKERGGGEFCNFYPHALGDFRPGVMKYDRLFWTDLDGKLKAHWLSIAVPQPGPIRLPKRAMVGYLNEQDGNPVVILENATPPARDDICLCWFDSHLIWDEPKAQGKELVPLAGPPYHYHAKLKAYWMNAEESKAVLARAAVVPLEPFAEKWANLVPIGMNTVNDFEWRADPSKPPVKFNYVSLEPHAGITLDDKVAHSGTHALRFAFPQPRALDMRTFGPELMITPGKRVIISAWVKTENVDGDGFWLESGFARFNPQTGIGGINFPETYQSTRLTGTHDWTKLEVPMPATPADAEFLGKRISFVFHGKGTVWVDDLEFREVAP